MTNSSPKNTLESLATALEMLWTNQTVSRVLDMTDVPIAGRRGCIDIADTPFFVAFGSQEDTDTVGSENKLWVDRMRECNINGTVSET